MTDRRRGGSRVSANRPGIVVHRQITRPGRQGEPYHRNLTGSTVMPALQRRCSSWSRHNGYPVVMPRPRRATRAWHDFTWCFSTAGCSPSPASRRMRVPLAGLADVLASIRRLPSGNFRLSLSVSLALAGWRLGSTPRYRQRRAWRILPPYWGGAGAEPDSRPFVILASHIGPPTGKTVVLYGMVVQDIFTAQPERTFLVHRRRVRVVSGVPGPPGIRR